MSLLIAQTVVGIFEAYFSVGALFAVVFVWRGVETVDPRVAGSPTTLRLLILPGIAALWPLFAARWIRGATPPVERNSHRAVAR